MRLNPACRPPQPCRPSTAPPGIQVAAAQAPAAAGFAAEAPVLPAGSVAPRDRTPSNGSAWRADLLTPYAGTAPGYSEAHTWRASPPDAASAGASAYGYR
jgi:hypothetical protein